MKNLEFRPTKRWLRDHKVRPKECVCPATPCCCVLDYFSEHGQGFCVGISLVAGEDLDIIRFCDSAYDPVTSSSVFTSRQWHPGEAQMVIAYLSMVVANAWSLLPTYRAQLGDMGRKRTRAVHRGQREQSAREKAKAGGAD